jgi:rhomboid protease GluP
MFDVLSDSRSRAMTARVPIVTAFVCLLTAAVSIVGLWHGSVLRSLERHPTPGAPWRLITALLVHDDWFPLAFNLIGLAIVGTAVERRLGATRWLVLYLVGGVVGELAGIWWQPIGAGNSVASFGLVGGLMAAILYERDTPVTFGVLYAAEWVLVYAGLELRGVAGALIGAALCAPITAVGARVRQTAPHALRTALVCGTLGLGVVLSVVHDIHGPPLIAGMIVGLLTMPRRG